MSEECVHGWDRSWCGECTPRDDAVDLHAPRGRGQTAFDYAREVSLTVTVNGDSYGLVPSDGTAYVFGAGTALHHDRSCYEGSDTPPERVVAIPDPEGDLWRAVVAPGSGEGRDRVVENAHGRQVTKACPLCALRPVRS